MKSVICVALLLAAVGGLNAEPVTGTGACPTPDVVQNFNATAYAITWYEVQRYYASNEEGLDCASQELYLRDDGTIEIVNTGRNLDIVDGENVYANGVGWVSFPEAAVIEGKLNVTFVPDATTADRVNYWILDTDYTNWALVWDCVQTSADEHQIFAWVLSSYYPVDEDVQADIDAAVANAGLDPEPFYDVFQHQLICLGGEVTPYE